jgi:hypothetical protein
VNPVIAKNVVPFGPDPENKLDVRLELLPNPLSSTTSPLVAKPVSVLTDATVARAKFSPSMYREPVVDISQAPLPASLTMLY